MHPNCRLPASPNSHSESTSTSSECITSNSTSNVSVADSTPITCTHLSSSDKELQASSARSNSTMESAQNKCSDLSASNQTSGNAIGDSHSTMLGNGGMEEQSQTLDSNTDIIDSDGNLILTRSRRLFDHCKCHS